VSVQDGCMVCTKCTIGSEIILDTLDGCKVGARFGPYVPWPQKPFWTHRMELLGDVGCVESCFSTFGDSICVGAR
jgi:hypothetical protein